MRTCDRAGGCMLKLDPPADCKCGNVGDIINHPPHYNGHPSGVECIDITEAYNFNVGNAIKYLWRAGLKSENPVEDLKKAEWYCSREIARLLKEVAP